MDREYRRGNWTLDETMSLIEAKRMDYERRMKRSKESSGESRRVEETRWKWVEEYCWGHGCCRSQNQCNDRWDNLMRDYKKVRTYELGLEDHDHHNSVQGRRSSSISYWKLDKHERKKRNLPCNLLGEIYEALTDLVQIRRTGATVERGRGESTTSAETDMGAEIKRAAAGSISSCSVPHDVMPLDIPTTKTEEDPTPSFAIATHSQPLVTTGSEESGEHSDLPADGQRKRKGYEDMIGGGSSRGGGSSSSHMRRRRSNVNANANANANELSTAISKCASIFAETMQTSQQKEEMRNRDLMNIEQRKAKLDESKSEISDQAIDGLATAINKLASSILGLVTGKATGAPKQ